jgi:hypothetical protein
MIIHQSDFGCDQMPERASHFEGFEPATERINHGFREPFATISHTNTVDFHSVKCPFDTSADGASDLSGI